MTSALDLVLPHVVAIQVKIERGFEFAGVGAAARKFALAPARQERLVHGQQVPPRREDALGIGLQIRAPGDQIEVRHVGTVPVQQHDLLEAVVGERFRDVEHVIDEMLEVIIDRAGKIHDVPGVAVADRGQHQQFVRDQASGAVSDPGRADDIDIERQMRAVLFHRAARHDADLAHLDGVIDLRPGQLFVAKFSGGAAHGFSVGFDRAS